MQLPDDWIDSHGALERTFELPSFPEAIAFVSRVADLAEEANHHPDIHIERYKTVRIVLTTHVTKGISRADIDLAKAVDAIA